MNRFLKNGHMKNGRAILIALNGKSQAGGVERVVYYMDEYFHTRNIKTKLVDEDYLIRHTLFGRLFNQLFRFRHFRKRKAKYMARYIHAWLRLYKRSGDIVITQGETAPFYSADFNVLHGCYHLMEVAYGRTIPGFSREALLQQQTCLRAKTVLAVSNTVKQDAIAVYGVPAENIKVHYNCVDTTRFHPFEKTHGSDRTILFVGRLIPQKGLAVLEQLAATIEAAGGWRLLIACNEAPETARFAVFSKTTVKTGLNVDNIAAFAYAEADLLILPSLFEGFELVTLEALSTGIPVTGTNVGAIRELLAQGFPGVYLLPDISAADPAILHYFGNLLDDFSKQITPQALHEQVKTQFGIARYMNELDSIMAPHFILPERSGKASL